MLLTEKELAKGLSKEQLNQLRKRNVQSIFRIIFFHAMTACMGFFSLGMMLMVGVLILATSYPLQFLLIVGFIFVVSLWLGISNLKKIKTHCNELSPK